MVLKEINLIIDIEDDIIQDYNVIDIDSVRMKDPEIQRICSDKKVSKCPHCFNDLAIVLHLSGLSGSVEYLDENNETAAMEDKQICEKFEKEVGTEDITDILQSVQVIIENKNTKDARHQREDKALVDREFCCSYCDKCFRNKAALIAHQRTCKLGPIIYDDKTKKHKTSREKKYQNALLRADHFCQLCNTTFKNSAALIAHMKTCTGHDIRCDLCGEQFENRKKLSKHSSVAHNKMNHVCFVCGSAFKAKWLLEEHVARHSGMLLKILVAFSHVDGI